MPRMSEIVSCPVCHADAGQPCNVPQPQVGTSIHARRARAAEIAHAASQGIILLNGYGKPATA